MAIAINENLGIEIKNLIREAHSLLFDIIEATRSSDIRAKSQNAKWWDRHRLHVLLDIAEETDQKLSQNIVVAPWFLAELKATIDIVKRWTDDPKWKDIKPSLKSKDHFTHTIGKLRTAEHFMRSGHKAQIVPRGKEASPDLRIQAIGGTQDWIYVECYQPKALTGEPRKIPENVIDKIVDRSMAKAKRQFEKKRPGIMAVFAFNQPKINLERLIQRIANRLDMTGRPYLAGFILLNQGVLFRRGGEIISFNPILSVEFISNPSYFSRIDVVSEFVRHRRVREIGLRVIEEPKSSSRAIVRRQDGRVAPFFKGTGNMNCLCGSCNQVLAQHIWKLSVSDVVVLCPSCQSYNEFPRIAEIQTNLPIKGTIALEKGTYDFSGWIDLKQGVIIFGK